MGRVPWLVSAGRHDAHLMSLSGAPRAARFSCSDPSCEALYSHYTAVLLRFEGGWIAGVPGESIADVVSAHLQVFALPLEQMRLLRSRDALLGLRPCCSRHLP